jgi:hypothetical protein
VPPQGVDAQPGVDLGGKRTLELTGHARAGAEAVDVHERPPGVDSCARSAAVAGAAGPGGQQVGERVERVACVRRVAPGKRVDLNERVEGDEGHGHAQVTPVEFHPCSAGSRIEAWPGLASGRRRP